jgi:hypothetical protein
LVDLAEPNNNGKDAIGRTLAAYESYMTGAGKLPKTHGHHIVLKSASGFLGQAASRETKDLLLYLGINPYWDRANLAFAPNPNPGGHTDLVMCNIRDEVFGEYNKHKADRAVATSKVKDLLKDIGQRWIDRHPTLGF